MIAVGPVLLLLALLGAPLFAVIAASAMFGFSKEGIDLQAIAIEFYGIAEMPILLAIPLFTFAGYLLSESGAPRRLVRLTGALLGWMPAGLAIVSLAACAFFTAFTGASGRKAGKFELANHGTIFMDEIGEMSSPLQAKLLQVLQDGEFCPLGGQRDVRVDVRVVAATNRNLEEMVGRGGFREDLYYRLNVVNVWVPPLRERQEEIPILIEHFLRRFSQKYRREYHAISEQLMQGSAPKQQRLWFRCRGRANMTRACRSSEMIKDEIDRPLGREQGDFPGKPFFVTAAGFCTHTTATTAVAHGSGTEQC